jgi:FkbM family methyltransferase
VVPLNIALLDKEGVVKLYCHPKLPSISSVIFKYSGAKKLKMKARTLDGVLNEHKICKVQWIKIDVEGAELLVLKGGEKLLNNKNIR